MQVAFNDIKLVALLYYIFSRIKQNQNYLELLTIDGHIYYIYLGKIMRVSLKELVVK